MKKISCLDKEVRLSIKMEQPWNKSFSSNQTKPYIVFSATIEEAVSWIFSLKSNIRWILI